MIEQILPECVMAVDTREDWPDVELSPAEQAAVGQAVEKRRLEFTTVRGCAREALRRLGLPPASIPSGPKGEPLWPGNVVGSLTHCSGYRGCALAHARDAFAIGIDAETHEPLPAGVLGEIARAEELLWLTQLRHTEPAVHWDRLLFSAKEAVYKTWFPLAQRWLGFEDATLTVDVAQQTFEARLLVPGPLIEGKSLSTLRGRWLVEEGLVLTAIALGRD